MPNREIRAPERRLPKHDDTIVQVRVSAANLEALERGIYVSGVRLQVEPDASDVPIYSLWIDADESAIPNSRSVDDRLEYLRGQLRAECISWSELAELQDLAEYIEPGDVELLEAAGVPEFPNDPKEVQ